MECPDALTLRERVTTSTILAAFFVLAYGLAQAVTARSAAMEPITALDRLIPFQPAWIWSYLWAVPAAFMPAFLIASKRLFQCAAWAYAIAIAASVVWFMVLPLSAGSLRPPQTELARGAPEWLTSMVYVIDPPRNLLPALHVSIPAIGAYALWKADRRIGLAAAFGVALIAVSACLVRQHLAADIAAALALALLVSIPTLGRLPAHSGGSAVTRRGAAWYIAFAAAFYGLVLLAWLAFQAGPAVAGSV